jgi:hypothetical protein
MIYKFVSRHWVRSPEKRVLSRIDSRWRFSTSRLLNDSRSYIVFFSHHPRTTHEQQTKKKLINDNKNSERQDTSQD